MEAFSEELRARIRGELLTDPVSRGIYATDASNYKIFPVAVLLPRDETDVQAGVETAVGHGISILPRGAGTSLAGQATGASLVIDFSKYMNRIVELNVEERSVRVQPGIVRDELNAALAPQGIFFAPDPATSDRANVGGMIGNNSSGMRSTVYGKTVDHVLATKVLLTDGEIMEFQELPPEEYQRRAGGKDREGGILREFHKIIHESKDEIERRFPKVMRRVGGYNLDEFIHTDCWNLAKLVTGSEGTLVTLLQAKLNLEPVPTHTSLCIPHFHALLEAIRAVQPILQHTPSTVEILDKVVIGLARKNLTTTPLSDFLEGEPEAVLLVEFVGETAGEAAEKAKRLAADLKEKGITDTCPLRLKKEEQARVWEVRKSGLGLMLGLRGDRKPIPFMEDAAVPVEVLPEYIKQVLDFCKKLETDVALYAHASVGLLHVRPILDLRRQEDIDRMKRIADESFRLVKACGGSWSGEHGDGLARSPYNEQFFGPRIYAALREVKRLFDPEGLMNPGKIVDAGPIDQNLRYGTSYRASSIPTQYQYRGGGSFAAAVEMCTGIGACRKTLEGTMCPSYRATRDEEHSTRGRANALRLAMTGEFGAKGLTEKRLLDVLALCLSCKACKSECPSNVDMAKMKGEFLQHYRDRRGTTLRDRMVGASAQIASLFSGRLAPVTNRLQRSTSCQNLLERIAGLDSRRQLPSYAREPFPVWFSGRPVRIERPKKKVVLFDDTYLNYHEPQTGKAAVGLLESLGYDVVIARAGCCQRPRISHGFLREAKRDGEKTLRNLDRFVREGLPIVVCEPSCASALTDDLPDLTEDEEIGRRVSENVLMIDLFLKRERNAGNLEAALRSEQNRLLIHAHCHQKALYGIEAMKDLLSLVPGLRVEEIDSGCCGMAGSFGYEKEHYDLSLKIGEDRLFPAIREAPRETTVVACGFSCRRQIEHATGVRPVHWVETIRGA